MLNLLKKILSNFFSTTLFKRHHENIGSNKQQETSKPDVYFQNASVVDKTPPNSSISKNDFIIVIYKRKPLWALFQCPCGCNTVISLSLQRIHTPHWTVSSSKLNRPTLYPSVWQNKKCFSHFWLKDGRIYWCNNSGIEPWIAEPNHYSSHKTNFTC